MTAPLEQSAKERALHLLEQIRVELENLSLESATTQLNILQTHLAEWHSQIRIEDARVFLDEAFAEDVLAFNVEAAQQQLEKWQTATGDTDADLANYQQRVEKYIRQREAALKVRGVLAYCDELLARAAELEKEKNPPEPDFILKQYYRKARGIAQSAYSEHSNDESLEILVQRTERLYEQALLAGQIYPMVLEDHKYTSALSNLDTLPSERPVPRLTRTEDIPGDVRLHFHSMTVPESARTEILEMARAYAKSIAEKAIQEARQGFDKHQPRMALDALEISDMLKKYLVGEIKTQFEQLQAQAVSDARNYDRAEELSQQAIALADEKPLAAWDEYARAYHSYHRAPSIAKAREVTVAALQKHLEARINEAEKAFNAHQMEQVQRLVQDGQQNYAGKDASLDKLLEQLTEIQAMVGRYQDYLTQAHETLDKVKDLLWKDVIGANELLSQVETYPDLVLEALPDVVELRRKVNDRLNADHSYNQLYQNLFIDDIDAVRTAITEVSDISNTYRDDNRFPTLQQSLQHHLSFIRAEQLADAGKTSEALERLVPLLNMSRHPDYEAAITLSAKLRPVITGDEASTAGAGE